MQVIMIDYVNYITMNIIIVRLLFESVNYYMSVYLMQY